VATYNVSPKEMTQNMAHVFVTVVEVVLGLRFILKLFGANSANGFVSWVYEMSSTLLAPFRGIFPVQVFENQYVLEFSTLFAMLVYMLFGLLVLMVIDWLCRSVSAAEASI
jgi:hypothetical protein